MGAITHVKKARKERGHCDYCHELIKPGDGYAQFAPRYGSRRRRHDHHPAWKSWEISDSLYARVERVAYEASQALEGDFDSTDEARTALEEAAEGIRNIADEQREKASNIEEGFGHPTYQSEEFESQADDLDGWADDIENLDLTEPPEQGDEGAEVDGEEETDEAFEDRFEEWRGVVRDEVDTALSDVPV